MTRTFYNMQERPDLRDQIWDIDRQVWPPFMLQDPFTALYWGNLYTHFAEYQFVLYDSEDAGGRVIAAAFCIPAPWDGTAEGLPEGWDAVLAAGCKAREEGIEPGCVSALAISIHPEHKGSGLSGVMLGHMREIAKQHGFHSLIAPVRPNMKSLYPLMPIEQYACWNRGDGLPFDPWLRTHKRAGASILAMAARSMVIPGSIAEWEDWAGMQFPFSGSYIVPGALQPVTVDVEGDRALYVEPNVWMLHKIQAI